MKIYIVLPFKESLDPKHSGAVSIFCKDIYKNSKYKNNIKIISSDEFKKKKLFRNQSYINDFCKKYKNQNIDIIELHNRPEYVFKIKKNFPSSKIILTFHNDPINLRGSKKISERKNLFKDCYRLIFVSNWIKKRFFLDINENILNYEIIYHGVHKAKNINLNKKKKQILFVGKLNRSKGYDIFVEAASNFIKYNNDWKFIAIGNESRKKIFPDKNVINEIGYKTNRKVLNYYKYSEISIGNSVWNEPLGRIAIESSSRKCLPIITNVGGLSESKNIGYVLKNNNAKELFNAIKKFTSNKYIRRKHQNIYYNKNNFDLKNIVKSFDNLRDSIILNNSKFILNKVLKILHITNFNERFYGRLHYNTGKRINNGFIRLGHNVLNLSDRDIVSNKKSILDPKASKYLNQIVFQTIENFSPDMIVLGHADIVNKNTIIKIKKTLNPYICQWFLDPLIVKGPDYQRNKKRILYLDKFIDATFLTTDPTALNFKINNSYFIPNPCDSSFETLNNSTNSTKKDLFFAMSHGVHRGVLKSGKTDDREYFLKKLHKELKNINFDIFGMSNIQPIWGNEFIKVLSNYSMALNLSRGKPIKYYSSDRIAQLMGNGLLTFIDSRTQLNKIINNKEAVFYKNISDLKNKIYYFKNRPNELKKIASNGRKTYHKKYNSTIISQYIIDKTTNTKSKQKYSW